ncbi:MAG: hypothetical protein A3G33_02355 [Omnitrophica bacterium RIFCSPLOWO2_12_FULL_44_17]|uniref:Uncharacterized protein n=1 Tax=Candidatus Danuiimicrobium aquiferis TaxID=1801832 RepID=A0A1G1L165_9BACT|nr:MAG: hypothetical protein A3B72_01935 [Omnitrophica bacterium RIFCSPHIGHO2_02_FULL_45_28]OGW90349.1 MAG: hypothetical protein A3E74_01405 [Omnitrophica bacterium RIFCSPHIGHO2_12_FULL_44_12]OGW98882.1 MAG: hypothetical protein A3G33_02355 [Omnitrophica bacterium RIFCSPLOWO2_12_FULL_44_17]OGX02009.1 MAG: hypothetical protein A3J12_11350 [Omnitrophica bacterium RIFCSPLOWO2_02_FULL_44_11]
MASVIVNPIGELEALALFKGWFNNKMMIILMMSQYPHLRRKQSGIAGQIAFFYDLEHHYLIEGERRRMCRNAIRWLKAFFKVYPVRISVGRSRKALVMVVRIYQSFGLSFNWNGKTHGSV